MKSIELGQGIISTVLVYEFLQFIDECREDDKCGANDLLSKFLQYRYPNIDNEQFSGFPLELGDGVKKLKN